MRLMSSHAGMNRRKSMLAICNRQREKESRPAERGLIISGNPSAVGLNDRAADAQAHGNHRPRDAMEGTSPLQRIFEASDERICFEGLPQETVRAARNGPLLKTWVVLGGNHDYRHRQ